MRVSEVKRVVFLGSSDRAVSSSRAKVQARRAHRRSRLAEGYHRRRLRSLTDASTARSSDEDGLDRLTTFDQLYASYFSSNMSSTKTASSPLV
jgi:hypothetical protein